jgi:hypothetical protein
MYSHSLWNEKRYSFVWSGVNCHRLFYHFAKKFRKFRPFCWGQQYGHCRGFSVMLASQGFFSKNATGFIALQKKRRRAMLCRYGSRLGLGS